MPLHNLLGLCEHQVLCSLAWITSILQAGLVKDNKLVHLLCALKEV